MGLVDLDKQLSVTLHTLKLVRSVGSYYQDVFGFHGGLINTVASAYFQMIAGRASTLSLAPIRIDGCRPNCKEEDWTEG